MPPARPTYLSDSAFRAAHRGPYHVDDHGGRHGRDPSTRQIAAMCRAIQQGWTARDWVVRTTPHLDDVGQVDGSVEMPEYCESDVELWSRDVFL